MRILLADDNRLFVEGLTDLLETYGHEIVATASDGLEAIARARVHRPDLVLMDIQMPRCDGLGAARAIAVERPGTRIVMLTTSDADEHLYEAIAGGAFGYLLKSMRGEELVEALGQVAEGVPPFSPGLAALLLSEFARRSARRAEVRPDPEARRGPPTSSDEDASDPFTPRELEVLRSVAAGRTYRETATLLDVSERTVRYHMSEMLARMHLEHRSQVIAYAAEHRLLDRVD
jgi:DNA-binding NarL/FixJ family response regulator